MMSSEALDRIAQAKLLIVDDEQANVKLLEGLLRRAGAMKLRSVIDSTQALPAFDEYQPDLILLDLHMPALDGFAVMKQMNARVPADVFLPILVLTADITRDVKAKAHYPAEPRTS